MEIRFQQLLLGNKIFYLEITGSGFLMFVLIKGLLINVGFYGRDFEFFSRRGKVRYYL